MALEFLDVVGQGLLVIHGSIGRFSVSSVCVCVCVRSLLAQALGFFASPDAAMHALRKGGMKCCPGFI